MVDILLKVTNFKRLILLSLWLQEWFVCVVGSEKVFFDKYGHCSRTEPFELNDDDYKVLPKGGGFDHETKDCSLSFKADPGSGVCITFDDFSIDDCSVHFLIYEAKKGETGDVWKELSCDTDEPSQMCTSERYVTLRVYKDRLNRNKGYEFEIKVEQSSSVTDEGVVFVSIALVIGIICAVVILLIIIALVVYCCCIKNSESETSVKRTVTNQDQLQPSAPPLLEASDYLPSAIQPTGLYPSFQEKPMLDPPPPYEQPPSYSPHNVHSS